MSPSNSPTTPMPQQYAQPVAYSPDGTPLYAHPPYPSSVYTAQAIASQPVSSATPLAHTQQYTARLPEDLQQKHEASVKQYPHLNLSPDEYVVSEIKRGGFGVVQIWTAGGVLFAALLLFFVTMLRTGRETTLAAQVASFVTIIIATIFIALGASVASRIYRRNRLFLTNESVIQEAYHSMFSKHEQTVGLDNIKNVTYQQHGIAASLLNFGTITLTLEGNDAACQFVQVTNPKQQCALITNMVEDFKRFRQQPS